VALGVLNGGPLHQLRCLFSQIGRLDNGHETQAVFLFILVCLLFFVSWYSCFLGRATTFCFKDNTFLQSTKYITVIRDMCDNVVTSVRACDSESGTFLIIRYDYIYQGSAMSPYMFFLVMNEATKDILGVCPLMMIW
jgi:hypothetical protein